MIWSLLTCSPKLSRTLRGVKEEMVFPMTYIIAEAYDTFCGGTPLSRIPKPFMFGKRFDLAYISELVNIRSTYARFHKGDEECNYNAKGVRGELESSHNEVLKHHLDKTVKGKSYSSSQD